MSKKKMPNVLSKFIDYNIRQLPYYSKLLSGELELTRNDGAAVYRVKRMEEMARIVNAIETEYNQLDAEKKEFVRLYYFSETEMTIGGVSQRLFISGRTGARWKGSFGKSIAIRLGWL